MSVALLVNSALRDTASPLALGADAEHLTVTLGSVQAHLHVVPVADEVARRAAAGLRAVSDRRTLALLADLPADIPVPANQLSVRTLRDLARLPKGCVRLAAHEVTRELVPAVRVSAAAVVARSWESGLRRATRFSPFCAKTVILPNSPHGPDRDLMLLQAHEFGVGVAVRYSGELTWLVHAKPFAPQRRSVASWLFEERVHSQLLDAQTSRARPSPPA